MLRPVGAAKYEDDLEGVAVWNQDVGTVEDRQPDWNSSLSQRLERAFDKHSLESRRRSFEDPGRTLTNRRHSDSERLHNSGSRATSGYGSVDVGGR